MQDLQLRIREFAQARAWQPFHTPKNLASALIIEAAELLEHFQWQTPEQSQGFDPDEKEAVALEMADVLIYLIRLADVMGIDLIETSKRKIEINALKYPLAPPARESDQRPTE